MLKRIRAAWFTYKLNKMVSHATIEYGREMTKSRHPTAAPRRPDLPKVEYKAKH